MTNYWLMKTEPAMFSIDTLEREGTTQWDGVRNYQARNFMMNEMEIGDMVLLYHSVTDKGIYGLARVSAEAHPDTTQFDSADEHYDPKSTREKPIWYCVDVEFVEKFENPVSLETLKSDPRLEGMAVCSRGSRLSIQPVTKEHFEYICNILSERKEPINHEKTVF